MVSTELANSISFWIYFKNLKNGEIKDILKLPYWRPPPFNTKLGLGGGLIPGDQKMQ